ncbi:B12-binding domain-containing radical SAM protein [Caulobacter sp. RL271]|uniref:Radical SAM domain protein n=1 Tax=Caulobacter segnis TaxID=88688 RepID=A0ABY4ZPV1_9CAUL|nr:hypothetical protein [Caulobacter segnis]USQ94570.1 hypothetical protein MZV50_18570 [Caulobacter segnis]
MTVRPRVLIICAHFHGDRSFKRDLSLLQPQAGLQIGSLIDPERYEIQIYQEMWHGSLTPDRLPPADIVFLSGLAKDFDRQRQLSYVYRRRGAKVIAGGYFCTMFPEFAARFFDAICAGGVDSVRDVMADLEAGALKPIYRSPQTVLSDYRIRYDMLVDNDLHPASHLVEASRGCNFKCDFCVIPAEGARHTKYGVQRVTQAIDDAVAASPFWSLRRWLPTVWFIDNNFGNDLRYLRELCAELAKDRRLKGWGALVTQDILKNRKIIDLMAQSGCAVLFTGLESLDLDFLHRHDKVQNLSKTTNFVDDIAYAQSRGIVVIYGYLFDPRITSVQAMRAQLDTILSHRALLFPSFIAIVSPLVGTKLFWQAASAGQLRPNLRLRDIDGQTVVYRDCQDPDERLTAFLTQLFRRPDTLVNRPRHLLDFLRRAWTLRRASPLAHVVHFRAHFRLFNLAKGRKGGLTLNYMAGEQPLDGHYDHGPPDITPEDRALYFDPILVTDAAGAPASWLEPYQPAPARAPAMAS